MDRRAVFEHFRPYRVRHWWRFKIPPLLCAALGLGMLLETPPLEMLSLAARGLWFICLAAAFGHAANEWADMEADMAAGKKNSMRPLSAKARVPVLLLPLVGAVASFPLALLSPLFAGLAAVEFILAGAYSLPPLRLKERGAWGVFADGTAAMGLPAVIMTSLFLGRAAPPLPALVFAAAWIGLSFVLGFEGILWHQDLDQQKDRKAGTSTYGARVGHERIRGLIARRLYPLEMVFLAAAMGVLSLAMPLVGVFFLLHLAVELAKVALKWKVKVGAGQARYLPFINNHFYELGLPFALCLTVATRHPWAAWLPLALALAFYGNVPQQAAEFLRLDADLKVSVTAWLQRRRMI
ncbi:MAG: UbiA family prenyltransferase [Deltaproteobacteria bacterium]|nr:UbiA family prenyltransferase [Deltaproteobacteria bacterium]